MGEILQHKTTNAGGGDAVKGDVGIRSGGTEQPLRVEGSQVGGMYQSNIRGGIGVRPRETEQQIREERSQVGVVLKVRPGGPAKPRVGHIMNGSYSARIMEE